jgi:DnaJ family protein C protein 28
MENKYRGIDEIIRQAMKAGAFDNLPGKGQPLKLDENPYIDPEWKLAYDLLKQNSFAPAFIEQRQAIELALAAARAALARTWAWCSGALAAGEDAAWVDAEWARAKKKFEQEVAKLNKQIADFNLANTKIASLHRKPISAAAEINSIAK